MKITNHLTTMIRASGLSCSLAALLAGFALISTAGGQSCVSPPAGLVGWWPGDGHFLDLAGTNNGTPLGDVTFAPGEVGPGFHFGGGNSAVFIPASPATDVGAEAGFTVAGWLKPGALSGVVMWFSWATANEAQYGPFGYLYGDYSAYFSIIDATPAGNWHIIQTPPNTITPGVMQQLALTYDKASGEAAIYLNGELFVRQNLGSFTVATAGHQIVLGRQPPVYGYPGVIDEFTIFKRALATNEIAQLYAAGSAGMCKDLKFFSQPQNASPTWALYTTT
jgi:hypothetical protein